VKVSDRVSGFLLVALGALTCYAASLLPTIAGQQIGPQVFPTVIGVALIACGVMIMIGVGSGFEDEEKLIVSEAGDLAKHQEAESLADRIGVLFAGGWKVVMPPLALFFYFIANDGCKASLGDHRESYRSRFDPLDFLQIVKSSFACWLTAVSMGLSDV
jgi:putative tricarboxylic transport membrane protein